MSQMSKTEPEQDLRLVYVFVVIVEALVVASLVWMGRVFS